MTENKTEILSVKGKVTHINVKSDGTPNLAQLLFVVNTAFVVTSGYPPQVFSAMASASLFLWV
jgi:hypothetical protein